MFEKVTVAQKNAARRKSASRRVQSAALLENGDMLTCREFERRYEAMPSLKKAELLGGVVYMSAAVRFTHGKPHGQILGWLTTYCAETPYIECADNVTVRLGEDNEVQPDAFLRVDEEVGGQSRVTDDDYIEGAPELVVEIANSSVSYDLHQKFDVYRQHGVREYLVWRVEDAAFDWFIIENDATFRLQPDEDGMLRSRVFPGLWLAVDALLANDMKQVLDVARQGAQSEEHRQFEARLHDQAVRHV